jgi:ubiquinone/menaquinone biosynthesis C-methylase UbiE
MYSYFEIQSKVGITKHMGGFKSTKELLEMCGVNDSHYVLVVGSGNGISAVKMHQWTGSKIIGIDISEEMVKSAKEKANEGIEFMVGNAEDLSFPDNTFDVVISESVTAFTNKNKSLSEYYRVLKKGGHLGLNEITWLQEPSVKMKDYAKRVMGLEGENKDSWISLLEQTSFNNINYNLYSMNQRKQVLGDLELQSMGFFKIWGRFIYYYLKYPDYRKSINYFAREARKIPGDFSKSFGYGLYVCEK